MSSPGKTRPTDPMPAGKVVEPRTEARTSTSSVAALIDSLDWSATPLGPREFWPNSLETALGLCLVSPLPTVIWWGPGLIQLYNQPFASYLGERHPSALAQPARECWADVWEMLAAPVETALQGRTSTIDLSPDQAPGARQTSMLFAPIPDGSGRAAGVWHSLLDLERRSRAVDQRAWKAALAIDNWRLFHEAQEAARQSQETLALLDTVFRTAPVGLAFLDRELRYVRINEALAAMNGRSVEEHLGATLRSIVPEIAATVEPLFRQVLETGEPIKDVEMSRARPEGANRHLLASYYPVRAPDGEVAWVGAVVVDITQQKLIEDALRQSNERYGAMASAVPAILFSTKADGSCDYVSEQFSTYTGLPASASKGFAGIQLIHPDDAERGQAQWRAQWLESMRTGLPFEIEFRLRRHDGVYRWFRCCCSPVRNGDGEVVKWFGLSLDIHGQREAEDAMRQSQKLDSIGLLAGGIAHDFNNLLTGILGNASLALRLLPKPSPAREMIHDVVMASERAAALTGQLLAYAGKGRFNIEQVNLAGLTRDISGLLRASIPRKVAIQLELDPGLPPIEADASQLQQVLMNLVLNASEAIGDNSGTVWVRAQARRLTADEIVQQHSRFSLTPGLYVEVEVTDSGAGIDPANLSRIFDPFFTTKFMGRGLGLAATLGIVRGHKGSITVRSELGKGSTFRILLPAVAESGTPAAAAPERLPDAQGQLILIADDEEIVRRAARATLQEAGYRVVEAEDGLAAVDLFRRRGDEIALVLLDMTMPILSGDEAVRHMMKIRPDAVVVASSGYGELEARRRFEGTGVTAFLQKPYTSEQLVALVGRLARREI